MQTRIKGEDHTQLISPRFWWVDWLRVISVLLVIPAHVMMVFMDNIFGPGLQFYIWNEVFISETWYILFFFDPWVMHLLFLLSGFSLVLSLKSRSFKRFAKERLKRLGIPILFGYLIWIPILNFVGVRYVYETVPQIAQTVYGTAIVPSFGEFYIWWWWLAGFSNSAHLWFLTILLPVGLLTGYIITVSMVKAEEKENQGKELISANIHPITTPSAVFPSEDSPSLQIEGLSTKKERKTKRSVLNDSEETNKQKSKNPNPAHYLLHPGFLLLFALLSIPADIIGDVFHISVFQGSQLVFFGYGLILAYYWKNIALIQRHSIWTLLVGMVCLIIYSIFPKPMFIFKYIGAWFLVYGLIGLFSRYCNKSSPILRYFSKSSMFIYIIHLPLQIIIGYYIVPLSFNPYLKILVLILINYGISFGLYEIVKRVPFKLLWYATGIIPPKRKRKK